MSKMIRRDEESNRNVHRCSANYEPDYPIAPVFALKNPTLGGPEECDQNHYTEDELRRRPSPKNRLSEMFAQTISPCPTASKPVATAWACIESPPDELPTSRTLALGDRERLSEGSPHGVGGLLL